MNLARQIPEQQYVVICISSAVTLPTWLYSTVQNSTSRAIVGYNLHNCAIILHTVHGCTPLYRTVHPVQKKKKKIVGVNLHISAFTLPTCLYCMYNCIKVQTGKSLGTALSLTAPSATRKNRKPTL